MQDCPCCHVNVTPIDSQELGCLDWGLMIYRPPRHLFSVSLLTCGMSQTGVWWAFLDFLSLFCHLSQQLLGNMCCSHKILCEWLFDQNNDAHHISLNMKYLVFLSCIHLDKGWTWFANHDILFLFLTRYPNFGTLEFGLYVWPLFSIHFQSMFN